MEDRVALLLQRLARHVLLAPDSPGGPAPVSAEAGDKVVSRAVRFAAKIVGSRLGPSLVPDEGAAAEAITRRLQREGQAGDGALFAELAGQLATQRGLHARWALLHVLLRIAEDRAGGEGALGAPQGAAVALMSSVLALPVAPAVRSIGEPRPLIAPLAPSSTDNPLAESALVRELLYACQGVDGAHLHYSAPAEGYILDAGVGVGRAARDMTRAVAELGWLFAKVRAAATGAADETNPAALTPLAVGVTSVAADSGGGAVAQALAGALAAELSEYYRLLAALEAQAAQGALTLRRLRVWSAEPLRRMRALAALADVAHNRRGGALASVLHAAGRHGDPLTAALSTRLLRRACAPLFRQLHTWLFSGELADPAAEFFIAADAAAPDEALWHAGYRLVDDMLPDFIPRSTAEAALRAGKGLNFLRRCCGGDDTWVAPCAAAAARCDARGGLAYGAGEALSSAVAEAAELADKHVMAALFGRFRFLEHAGAVRSYLLLGAGDLIQSLMDTASVELGARAASLSAFKLAGLLEAAIRSSNAQFDDPEVSSRLRVKLMPAAGGGESGWDVFSLDYAVGPPLSAVFTPTAVAQYLRVFNFLWRLKRVEHALIASWAVMKPNSPELRPRARQIAAAGPSGAAAAAECAALASELRRCHSMRSEMQHFATSLQYYVMFEVLDASWANFQGDIAAARDLDTLLAAHARFLDAVVQKALLGDRSQVLQRQLASIFDLVLRFRGVADRLHEAARAAAARLQLAALQAQQREAAGTWAAPAAEGPPLPTGFVADMGGQLDAVAREYGSLLDGFLSLLAVQTHVDLRHLVFRLDFSQFYAPPLKPPA